MFASVAGNVGGLVSRAAMEQIPMEPEKVFFKAWSIPQGLGALYPPTLEDARGGHPTASQAGRGNE